jgi:hypothetical protein
LKEDEEFVQLMDVIDRLCKGAGDVLNMADPTRAGRSG